MTTARLTSRTRPPPPPRASNANATTQVAGGWDKGKGGWGPGGSASQSATTGQLLPIGLAPALAPQLVPLNADVPVRAIDELPALPVDPFAALADPVGTVTGLAGSLPLGTVDRPRRRPAPGRRHGPGGALPLGTVTGLAGALPLGAVTGLVGGLPLPALPVDPAAVLGDPVGTVTGALGDPVGTVTGLAGSLPLGTVTGLAGGLPLAPSRASSAASRCPRCRLTPSLC